MSIQTGGLKTSQITLNIGSYATAGLAHPGEPEYSTIALIGYHKTAHFAHTAGDLDSVQKMLAKDITQLTEVC